MRKRARLRWPAVLLFLVLAAPIPSAAREADEHRTYNAMWLSIAHPGLGEWYLKGWGHFAHCPQKKFWLGFIPFYGWPGYLQVKSAIDAHDGKTNDDLTFDDEGADEY